MPRLEARAKRAERAVETMRRLREAYPETNVALDHEDAFQLLVATVLSAQATDAGVNKATPGLFARAPDAATMATLSIEEIEGLIATIGLFRSKAKHLAGLARMLVDDHDGEVPEAMEDLVRLPGVGRKTANVVRGVWFGLPGLVVDTHVARIVNLLDLARGKDAVKLETELCRLLPPEDWSDWALHLIAHGRAVCIARRPRCAECVLADLCPSAAPPV